MEWSSSIETGCTVCGLRPFHNLINLSKVQVKPTPVFVPSQIHFIPVQSYWIQRMDFMALSLFLPYILSNGSCIFYLYSGNKTCCALRPYIRLQGTMWRGKLYTVRQVRSFIFFIVSSCKKHHHVFFLGNFRKN